MNWRGKRSDPRLTAALVWTAILLYSAFFSYVTVLKHEAFETTAFDLGNVDQAVWNTRHGRPLAMTNIEGLTNRLGTHVEPILVPTSLLYFVWSDPRALLILQTVVIALGAWPVYQLVKWRTSEFVIGDWGWQGEVLGVVFAVAYLLFPALQSANAFDFHAVSLAPSLFLFAFYCLETERWGWFSLFAVLSMSCKEDMPLLVAMLGLYALVAHRARNWRVALPTIAVAGTWFLVAVGWVMPHFDTGGVSPLANRYAYLGDGPLEMALAVVRQPGLVLDQLRTSGSFAYVRDLLEPVAFLSLLAPQVLLLAIPPLAVNLLSTDSYMHQLEGFHYGATLAPITVVSAIYGVAWLMRRLSRFRYLPSLLAGVILVATLLYHRGHGYTPLAAGFRGSWPTVSDHDRQAAGLIALVPEEATVSAQSRLNPHLSQREKIYMFPRVEDAEYVFFDVTADSWPIHPNDQWRLFQSLTTEEGFGVLAARDGYILLRRGATDGGELPEPFYSFARCEEPDIEYPATIEFGDKLRFLGFDVDREGGMTSLSLYWQALIPVEGDYRIYPFFYDDGGTIIEDTTQRPMTTAIWYPTSLWKPGEIISMQTLPWDVGSDFHIGLGVIDGDSWSVREERLKAGVTRSALRVLVFEGDTAVELAEVREGQITTPARMYDRPDAAYPVMAGLGEQIELVGYEVMPDPSSLDGRVRLALYWKASEGVDGDFTVFTHLIDGEERIVAQHDSRPDGGRYPTSQWLEGEIVEDEHILELPAGQEPGEYTLVVGMYDAESGERLPAYDELGRPSPQRRVVLTTVRVED